MKEGQEEKGREKKEKRWDYRGVEREGCITIWRELEGKMGSPYCNSRQSYCHGPGWSWNCGWSQHQSEFWDL